MFSKCTTETYFTSNIPKNRLLARPLILKVNTPEEKFVYLHPFDFYNENQLSELPLFSAVLWSNTGTALPDGKPIPAIIRRIEKNGGVRLVEARLAKVKGGRYIPTRAPRLGWVHWMTPQQYTLKYLPGRRSLINVLDQGRQDELDNYSYTIEQGPVFFEKPTDTLQQTSLMIRFKQL